MNRRAVPCLLALAALTFLSLPTSSRADLHDHESGGRRHHRRSAHDATPSEAETDRERRDEASDDDARWRDPMTERGQTAHGLYLGASFVRQEGAEGVIAAVHGAHMNAAVIDVKDAAGQVHYDSQVPELRGHHTGWLGDARALVSALHEADIYAIARIACFADRRLPAELHDRSIQHIRNHDRLWVSWGTGGTWLDPYNEDNHRMIVALAREAQELGFDEVQLDYVRFPVDDGTQYAYYPSQTDEDRPSVIMRLLRAVDEAITIPLGVDVFGLTAYRRGDPSGLGQDLERWTRHVEVLSPMLYVNSMRAWRVGEPDRAFNLVYDGLSRLRHRVGERPVIRPFLQAFSRGADNYGPEFIDQQVRAARRAHADGLLFWHPGITYGVVRRAMRQHSTRGLLPFPLDEDLIAARSRPRPPSAPRLAEPARRRCRPGVPCPPAQPARAPVASPQRPTEHPSERPSERAVERTIVAPVEAPRAPVEPRDVVTPNARAEDPTLRAADRPMTPRPAVRAQPNRASDPRP